VVPEISNKVLQAVDSRRVSVVTPAATEMVLVEISVEEEVDTIKVLLIELNKSASSHIPAETRLSLKQLILRRCLSSTELSILRIKLKLELSMRSLDLLMVFTTL